MLLDFPIEILQLILNELPNRTVLKHLCEVSRSYNQTFIPILYETIDIKKHPHEPSLAIKSLISHRSTTYIPFVRNLKFSIEGIEDNEYHDPTTFSQCVHSASPPGNKYDDPLVAFCTPILSFLNQLQDNQLESLRWGVGTCLPPELFGPEGLLARKQNRLRSLWIEIDLLCEHSTKDSLDLTAFKDLRDFTWKNIVAHDHAEDILGSWLRSEPEALQSLDLRFGLDYDQSGDRAYSEFLYSGALGIDHKDKNRKLPSLKHLTLSDLLFKPYSFGIVRFFNFSALHTLRIRECFNPNNLIQAAVESNTPIKLTTFELLATILSESHTEEVPSIRPFLESFSGLHYLHLNFDDSKLADYHTYLHSISKHSPTLKELVFEQALLDLDLLCRTYCCTEDGFLDSLYHSVEPLLDPLLSDGNLQCLGFHDSFILLKPYLQPSMKKSLKLLHLRKGSRHVGPSHDDRRHKFSLFLTDIINTEESETHEKNNNLSNPLQPEQHHQFPRKDFQRSRGYIQFTEFIREKKSDRCLSSWYNYMPVLLEFVQWAFGPDGFPNLRYLAFGNFTENTDAEDNSIMFYRSTLPDGSFPAPSMPPPQPSPEWKAGTGGAPNEQANAHLIPRFKLLQPSSREFVDPMTDYRDFLTCIPAGLL
ncbi:hypothetical protein FQN54_008521 [Arachnomyces sp. PD_36]|nr:hypothetical protein FQN54_008521 [Arachnomyces sp. PD_36]